MELFIKYRIHIIATAVSFYIVSVIFAYSSREERDLLVVLNSLGTFISSTGAMAALLTLLHVLTERKSQEVDKNVATANFTLTCIARQAHLFDIYAADNTEGYIKGKQGSALNLFLPNLTTCFISEVSLADNVFITISGKPNLLGNLLVIQDNCEQFSKSLRERNELHISGIVQKKEHMICPHASIDTPEILDGISPLLISNLIESTDGLIELLPQLSANLKSIHSELYAHLKDIYPDHKFIEPLYN